jgi:hypothetical protein
MVGVDYYSQSDLDFLKEDYNGFKNMQEAKKEFYYPAWYTDNEIFEFSKGNRDYIAGFIPEKEMGGCAERPIILNPNYKKKVLKDGTIIVTHYDFDCDNNWKKETYICNAETGLTLVEYTKTHPVVRPARTEKHGTGNEQPIGNN